MTETKKKVRVRLERRATYVFETELTKAEYDRLKECIDGECHGADVAWLMKKEIQDNEPDDFSDEADIEEGWEDE